MTIDTITREALIEKLKQYPTLLQQFMVLVDTQGTTLDDIQEILKLAQQASSESSTSLEKVNTLSTKLDNEINRAVVEELTLQASVAKEKADRVSSDNALQENIDAKQNKLTAGDNIKIEGDVISSTAGSGSDEKISKLEDKVDNEINRALNEELSLQGNITKEKEDRVSADNTLQENIDGKQDKLTAGENIKIEGNVISATGGSTPTDYVDLSSEQTISGVKTFSNEVKTNQIANANDNAMLRYKETENKVVVGGSTIPTTIMGSGDRPTYSKDGSDFNGSPLALLNDVDSKQDKLTAGDNIKIEGNVISATSSGGGGGTKLYLHEMIIPSATYHTREGTGTTTTGTTRDFRIYVISNNNNSYGNLANLMNDAYDYKIVQISRGAFGYTMLLSYDMDDTMVFYSTSYALSGSNLIPTYDRYYVNIAQTASDTVTEL